MNATTKHTPRIEVLNDHGEARIYDGPEDDASAIALVYAGLPPPWTPALIAAAPALLAALDAIARGLTNGQKERGETFQTIAAAALRIARGA